MSSSLPLQGASLYLVGGDEDDARSLELANFVSALGGTVVQDDVTHAHIALWCGSTAHDFGHAKEHMAETLHRSSNATHAHARAILQQCLQREIPVVEPSWLEQVSSCEGDWSRVDATRHAPSILAFVNKTQPTVLQQVQNASRRDTAAQLAHSISETCHYLTQQDPEQMELAAIQRAVDLSMLDRALVYHKRVTFSQPNGNDGPSPYTVLHIPEQATIPEIKAAFRSLARRHHPDKGGDGAQFEQIARAYRTLLAGGKPIEDDKDEQPPRQVKGTAHWDTTLQDHRRLVQDMFTSASGNLHDSIAQQDTALKHLGLMAQDAGSRTRNEQNEILHNSCFYLSLAASYLHGIGALEEKVEIQADDDDEDNINMTTWDLALLMDTALQLKRCIEAAVVRAHPEWAARGMVGDHIQAFSDFLTYVLEENESLVADWAVVVFDSCSGFCDIYKGSRYNHTKKNTTNHVNTITLRYIPGHYQPLVPTRPAARPSLEQVLKELDAAGVFYVVTDGS